jgi:uncharacterized cofD-like protein
MTDVAGSGLRVVVLGGGTGISPCLSGLKDVVESVTAIVTVADDGGSSGRLRKDYDMLPPGDIRNCLVALSSAEPLLAELFSYRFEDSLLRGHAFGNLFLAVLTRLTGDFRQAIERARTILNVKGRVLPSTDSRVVLVATHEDGTKSTGEQSISKAKRPVASLALKPAPPRVSTEIVDALKEADLVVLGPGSLLTSIVPNLLVPGMAEAVAACKGRVLLVANLATQPGETDGFDLERHVATLRSIGRLTRIDRVLVHDGALGAAAIARYEASGASLLFAPSTSTVAGVPVVRADVAHETSDGKLRHHGPRLAAALAALAAKT